MEHEILGFDLYTERPEVLEHFLSEVLGLEISPGPGLFRVLIGRMAIDVFHGEARPLNLKVAMDAEAFADLGARFEFFQFRSESAGAIEFLETENVFIAPGVQRWSVIPEHSFHRREVPEISVRNC